MCKLSICTVSFCYVTLVSYFTFLQFPQNIFESLNCPRLNIKIIFSLILRSIEEFIIILNSVEEKYFGPLWLLNSVKKIDINCATSQSFIEL